MNTLLKGLACLRAVVMPLLERIGFRLAPRASAGQCNDPPSSSHDQLNVLHALERELAETRTELQHAREDLESFSYALSHDLRSPLRAIEGFSHVLVTRFAGQLPPQGLDYLSRVRKASQRMGQMFDDLLWLSRVSRQSVVVTELDLSAMAEELIAELQARDPGRVVEVSIQGGVHARGDLRLSIMLMRSLLLNAWKYTLHNSRARIEFGAGDDVEGSLYWVRDNGVGFDMRHATRLFTPFQRLHPSSEFDGHGIGLATAQRAVQRHGGVLWCESAPDQGATFYFRFGMPSAEAGTDRDSAEFVGLSPTSVQARTSTRASSTLR